MQYFLILLVFILAGCGSVRDVPLASPIAMSEDAVPAPIDFTTLKIKLPTGEDAGRIYTGTNLCGFPIVALSRSYFTKAIYMPDIRRRFRDTLEGQGYDVVSTLDLDFDEEIINEMLRSEYRVMGRIIDVDIDGCDKRPGLLFGVFDQDEGFKGKLMLRIEWAVFDALQRRTIYKTVTEGTGEQGFFNEEGLSLAITNAFEVAAHNLGAQPDFYNLIVKGIKPPEQDKKDRKYRPRNFDPIADIVIPRVLQSSQRVRGKADQIQQSVVLIQGGVGHGSGFFIDDKGTILTNQHVVGNAERVRVVTHGKEQKLVAEVIRDNRARDVAVLRLIRPVAKVA